MRVILCGPGASGKDHLKRKFEEKGFVNSVSCTTRPPREGETHGLHYYFLSDAEFDEKVENGEFLEYQDFPTKLNGEDVVVRYGTLNEHFEKSTIFIMTPSGIADLNEEQRRSSMIMFLDVPEDVRRERLSERVNGDDVETRLENDRKDFENFTDYDMRVTNPDF